MLNAL
jgi:hypothetical protein